MAGIYVHIPFCHSKCAYCDFYSIAGSRRVEEYTLALAKEWDARRAELSDLPINTIYFGGGTPSILSPEYLRRIANLFPREVVSEFTIEVNPEDVNPLSVAIWREFGVNRVSMGVQSLIDSELAFVGRRHSAADAIAAINCLRDCGISNISADLIYGLPGQTCESWQMSLDRLLSSSITHLSAYCLSYEPGTRLYLKRERGEIVETDDETLESMYHQLCYAATEAGFDHYEISNFAKPDCFSRHNSSYWDGTPYLGLGPGAHSLTADATRKYVPSSLNDYLAHPQTAAVVDSEDDTDRLNDRLLISLRTARGINLMSFSQSQKEYLLAAAQPHISAGRLLLNDSNLRVPESQWLLCDLVLRDLFFE